MGSSKILFAGSAGHKNADFQIPINIFKCRFLVLDPLYYLISEDNIVRPARKVCAAIYQLQSASFRHVRIFHLQHGACSHWGRQQRLFLGARLARQGHWTGTQYHIPGPARHCLFAGPLGQLVNEFHAVFALIALLIVTPNY